MGYFPKNGVFVSRFGCLGTIYGKACMGDLCYDYVCSLYILKFKCSDMDFYKNGRKSSILACVQVVNTYGNILIFYFHICLNVYLTATALFFNLWFVGGEYVHYLINFNRFGRYNALCNLPNNVSQVLCFTCGVSVWFYFCVVFLRFWSLVLKYEHVLRLEYSHCLTLKEWSVFLWELNFALLGKCFKFFGCRLL